MENQLLNLNANFLGGYSGIFTKILMAIILIYGLIMIVNFLRDKFVKNESVSQDPQITDLLIILNKVCCFTGYGFVLGNIIQFQLRKATVPRKIFELNIEWNSLMFGIILIFLGIGFKAAKKGILKRI